MLQKNRLLIHIMITSSSLRSKVELLDRTARFPPLSDAPVTPVVTSNNRCFRVRMAVRSHEGWCLPLPLWSLVLTCLANACSIQKVHNYVMDDVAIEG